MTAIMTEITGTAPTTQAVLYVHHETRIERYVRLSNESAGWAAYYGGEGDERNAETYARYADMWADLAAACRFLELALERLP